MSHQPDISIAIITYHQEKYIKQTLDGVAMQNFTGTIEIVIGDDCSTDSTRSIIKEFVANRSNIKLLFHKRNLGMVGNWTSVLSACSGKYIAVCEGDDYWTNPYKLQLQYDFLSQNIDFSMCWHPVNVISEGVERPFPYSESKEVSNIDDLILTHFIPTCSLMFRNILPKKWPKWIYKAMSFDIALEMLLGTKGMAKRLSNEMGTYRQHPGGISKSNEYQYVAGINQLNILKHFNNYTFYLYDKKVREKMRYITVYHLKLNSLKSLKYLFIRFRYFYFHLYAKKVGTIRELKEELYYHLIPELYSKLKK